MTSSDRRLVTRSADAMARRRRRRGRRRRSTDGRGRVGARRRGASRVGAGLRRVQRRDHRPAARRRPRRPRGRPGRRSTTVTVAWVPGAFELPLVGPAAGRVRRPSTPWSASGRSSGATPATTTSWPASAPSGCSGSQLDTGVPVVFGVLTTDTVDQALARSGAGRRTNKGREAAVTALEMVDRAAATLSARSGRGRRRRARSDRGDADCSGWSCPRARSRRPPSSCSPPPTSPCPPVLGRRLPGHASTTPGSTRSASCGPRRSPSTWPTGSSTSGSPGATGSRSGAPRWSRSASSPYSKATANPIRVVLAVAERLPGHGPIWPICPAGGRCGSRPSTPSSPGGASRSTGSRPRSACPTAPPRPRSPTSPTAWSRSPRPGGPCAAAGLRIVETLLVSRTELIANPDVGRGPRQAPRHGPAPAPCCRGARGPGQGAASSSTWPRRALEPRSSASCRRCGRRRSRSSPAAAASPSRPVVPKSEINVLDPRAQGPGRHRHHRAAPVQDRPLSRVGDDAWPGRGAVRRPARRACVESEFDDDRGPRDVVAPTTDGRYPFHCTAIWPTGPGRSTSAGRVVFVVAAGHRRARSRPASLVAID